MDQLSRPFLIALVAVVGFAGVWMTMLRPKADTEAVDAPLPTATAPAAQPKPAAAPAKPASSAPGAKGLTRAVDKAKAAAEATAAANAATQSADPEETAPAKAASAPATAKPAPAPAAAAAKPAPKPGATLAPRKIVLLFAGRGADDGVARDVVRSVRRPGVRTIIATLSEAGKYRRLLGDVHIEIAPTIVVIGRDRKARRIAGLPDVGQLRIALAAAP